MRWTRGEGYRVFGTAMSLDEIADLKKASGGAVNLSQCDITNEAAVKLGRAKSQSRMKAASIFS